MPLTTLWVLPLNKACLVSVLPHPMWTLTSLPCQGLCLTVPPLHPAMHTILPTRSGL